MATMASGTCAARDGSTVTSRASAALRPGSVTTETAISRKLTSIEVTRISTPRKKSPATWQPMMPSVAMPALARIATCGVRKRGCTAAIARGKIPSSAHANIRRDTASSIAGRSLINATAAPETITTVHAGGSR